MKLYNSFFAFYNPKLSLPGGVLSPECHDLSLDECFDSDDESDHDEEFSSDAGIALISSLDFFFK